MPKPIGEDGAVHFCKDAATMVFKSWLIRFSVFLLFFIVIVLTCFMVLTHVMFLAHVMVLTYRVFFSLSLPLKSLSMENLG